MDKFPLERFEEIIECYFLPGSLTNIVLIMIIDLNVNEKLVSLLLSKLSFFEGLVFTVSSLIVGMILDSTRHLLFERSGLFKSIGVKEIPRLDFFISGGKIEIDSTKFEIYKYFTRSTYYFGEFCGNVGLILWIVPFFLRKFISNYFVLQDSWHVCALNVIVFVISLSLLANYFITIKTYAKVIKKLK